MRMSQPDSRRWAGLRPLCPRPPRGPVPIDGIEARMRREANRMLPAPAPGSADPGLC